MHVLRCILVVALLTSHICWIVSSTELSQEDDDVQLDYRVRKTVENILKDKGDRQIPASDTDLKDRIVGIEADMKAMKLKLWQQSKAIEDVLVRIRNLQNSKVSDATNMNHVGSDIIKNDTKDRISVANRSIHNVPVISTGRLITRRVRRSIAPVAFSVYLTITNTHMAIGQLLRFDQVLLNDGNGYKIDSGKFIVPLSGVYLFSFNFDTTKTTFVRLVVDDVNVVDAVANPHSGQFARKAQSMGGNSAIIHVGRGREVFVQVFEVADADISSSSDFHFCTFSGVLLY